MIEVMIEIPAGSTNKYEIKEGELTLDREVKIPYPHNYGYITNTLAEDNDPLDVFVIGSAAIHPGTKVQVTPVCMVQMLDGGVKDHKVIASFGRFVTDYDLSEIKIFLQNYKEGVVVGEIVGLSDTNAEIAASAARKYDE